METCLQRNIVNGSGGSVVSMTEAILTAEVFLIWVHGGWKAVLTEPVTTCVTRTGSTCNAGRQGNNRSVRSLIRHISDELPHRRTNWEREIRQGSHVRIYSYILCLTSLPLASFRTPSLLFGKVRVCPIEHLLLIQMFSSLWWVALEIYNKSGWGVGV